MSLSKLPFDILGQVGPILAWVEADDGGPLPDIWTQKALPFSEREKGWLLQELPTYSYDNVEEIVLGTRFRHRRNQNRPARLPFLEDRRHPRLDPPFNYELLQAFRHLNHHFLVWNGTEPCIRAGLMEELHELALRLPAAHIVRHSHSRAVAEGVISFKDVLELPESVTLLPSNSFGLRTVIRRGLSESHLHLAAITSAEETWADSLLKPRSSVAIQSASPKERRLLTLNYFAGRILALAIWLSLTDGKVETSAQPLSLLALFDRLYFARTLHEEHWAKEALESALRRSTFGRHGPQRSDLATSLIARAVPEQYRFLLRWISPIAWRFSARSSPGDSRQAIPGPSEGLGDRCRLVHQLHLAAHLRLIELSSTAPLASQEARAEGRPRLFFLHRALFRYIVCSTHHWQLATQQGHTTGLRHFRKYFGSPHRRPKGITRMQGAELVFNRLRQWRGLRVLEGRISPPRDSEEIVPWILAWARPEDRRIQKFGLVVHFKKEAEHLEDRTFTGRLPSPALRLRWGKRRRKIRGEGMRLYRLLRRPTPITPFIVGIDACSLELATPPEVFAPVFRFLREFPIALTGESRHFAPYASLDESIRNLAARRRLGMTYHVGEDFRHLLSGLRAISEVVEFLAPQPGDRLGHGTALALRPLNWLRQNGFQAVVPKLEWLDTLVWVHHLLGPGDDIVGELAIEDLIQRFSTDIYSPAISRTYDPLRVRRGAIFRGDDRRASAGPGSRGLLDWDWSPLTLWEAWRLRQLDPYSIDIPALLQGELQTRTSWIYTEEERRWQSVQERVVRELKGEMGSRNTCILLALYWLDPEVRRQGNEITIVDMNQQRDLWLELCQRVEEKMKTLIHERELVVEVNPSSNRIIGPMASYDQHHVFQLTLDENRRLKRGVRVSVNTDNPAVCNTTLAHEHYLIGEILIAQGVPEAETVEWLEWLRQNGEAYNFVRRLQAPEESPDMRQIIEWLRGIRKSVREAGSRDDKFKAFWRWQKETRLRSLGFSGELISQQRDLVERIALLEKRIARRDACSKKKDPGQPGSSSAR